MSDTVDPEKRSWIMSRIRGKDTKIEVALRHYLFKAGFRYRKNDRRYPGTPDVVLPRFRTVIFVNGCFWHGHEGCKKHRIPKTRTDYWEKKIERNRRNDKANIAKLKEMGWNVIVVWECEVEADLEKTMVFVIERLHQNLKARQEALAARKAEASTLERQDAKDAEAMDQAARQAAPVSYAPKSEKEDPSRAAEAEQPYRAIAAEKPSRAAEAEQPYRAAEAEPFHNPSKRREGGYGGRT